MSKLVFVGLLPLLVLYCAISFTFSENTLAKDETRYAAYAENISQGFYTSSDSCFLWNGPGYPLILAPFAEFDWQWKWAKRLNAFFLFGSVICIYLALNQYTDNRKSLAGAWIFGLYFPTWTDLPKLYTECLSILLVSAFCLSLIYLFKKKKLRYLMLAGLCCGFLILTKVMFAYVAICGLVFALLYSFKNPESLKIASIYLIAFIVTSPYLFYTYNLTGKLFYWSNAGGTSAMCMTNPNPHEYGDWKAMFSTIGPEKHPAIHHELKSLNYVEKDAWLKNNALKTLREYPKAYIYNWSCNLGRLWFNMPFSYKQQRPHTLVYIVPNAILFTGSILGMIVCIKQRKLVSIEIGTLVTFAIIYIGGSSLVCACGRYLFPIVPILSILIFFTGTNLLDISLAKHGSSTG